MAHFAPGVGRARPSPGQPRAHEHRSTINSDVSTLNVELGRYQPPAPPPAPTLLDVARGLDYKAGGTTSDLTKLRAMFPTAGALWGKDQGMWADPSSMLEVYPDGRFRVVLDRANWANI